MEKIIGHIKNILIHKTWVLYYCWHFGILWRGLVHDLSKFHPMEFEESIRFYQGNGSPIVAAKKAQGYSLAWLHHRANNKHHFEYWFDKVPVEMPKEYRLEMLADYLAAGRTYQKEEFTYAGELAYVEELFKKYEKRIHPKTAADTIDNLKWFVYIEENNLKHNLIKYIL